MKNHREKTSALKIAGGHPNLERSFASYSLLWKEGIASECGTHFSYAKKHMDRGQLHQCYNPLIIVTKVDPENE